MEKERLLQLLNAHCVEFVIIGATAFPLHGYARATLDIDVFIRPDPENARRIHAALAEFGYDLSDVTPDDLLRNKVLIRQYVVALDVHPFVRGVGFADVWDHRVMARFGSVEVPFASLEDLIVMKRAAGRPKDVEDLRVLERLAAGAPVEEEETAD
ncbi:MAG: nucleotidyltransferase [Proteobacteria bacterium]|jgi:predicted nucleotidyltransferase|nr:nucleotidyltransferase [Pseudomonadota bacterium]